MIDHVTIQVSDLARSKEFYEKVFAPLGWTIAFEKEGVFHAFEVGNKAFFEIAQAEGGKVLTTTHTAFRVGGREDVDAFYRSALEAGAKDNGKPGPRPQYTETYYAAFVLDPDGHNIEAMID